MQPLLNDLGDKTDQKLAMLSDGRVALEKMVTREREALVQMIEEKSVSSCRYRDIWRELHSGFRPCLKRSLALAIDKLMELIKGVIIYFILFILVVFFAPLGIGYWLGKRDSPLINKSSDEKERSRGALLHYIINGFVYVLTF